MKLSINRFFAFMRVPHFGSTYQWWLVILWPICAAALILNNIYALDLQERTARAALSSVAQKEGSALASAYALQLSHTVDQLDQSLLNLKYFWEYAPGLVSLKQQAKQGMYPLEKKLYVAIFDRRGSLIDSTVPVLQAVNISSHPLFEIHALNPDAGLSITKHEDAPGISQVTVWFSRRLETKNGDFAGVISIAVEPHYLGSFYDRTALGRGDFVTVRSTTGKILSTKMGEQIRSYSRIFRKPPVFNHSVGVTIYPSAYFNDNESRLYAWDTLEKYPLISTVGLLENDIYANLVEDFRAKRQTSLAETFAIVLVALAGALLTFFWVKRRYQEKVSRERFLIAIESGNEGFFSLSPITDRSGKTIDFVISECNERGANMLGHNKSDMIGAIISSYSNSEKFPVLLSKFILALNQGSYQDEFVSRDADGTQHVLYRHLIRSAQGIALTLRDISETRQYEAQLQAMANSDALTKAFNRHWLMSNLPAALERAATLQEPLALLFIDLDNFKEINNIYGHTAGDALLVLTCARFRDLIRPQDQLVRWGGDEFAIVLEKIGRSEISHIANRIIEGISKPFNLGDVSTDLVGVSIGISVFPEDGVTVDTLVQHADDAMYEVKRSGKADYRFYTPK